MCRLLAVFGWLWLAIPVLAAPIHSGLVELEASTGQDTGRRMFRCRSGKVTGSLGYDLRYRVYFEVWVEGSEFRPARDATLTFRVTSLDVAGQELVVSRPNRFASLGPDKPRDFGAHDGFLAGPGRYRIDWELVDDLGGICFGHDRVDLRPEHPEMPLRLSRGEIRRSESEFGGPVTLSGAGNSGLSVRLVLNIPPYLQSPVELDPTRYRKLRQSIEAIASDERVAKLEVVAFSPLEREILFRARSSGPSLDLSRFRRAVLGRPMRHLVNLGTYSSADRIDFFRGLMQSELFSGDTDVIIVLGPGGFVATDWDVAISQLPQPPGPPISYIRFSEGGGLPVSDPVSRLALRSGGRSYSVADPYQFWKGIDDILTSAVNDRKVPAFRPTARDDRE